MDTGLSTTPRRMGSRAAGTSKLLVRGPVVMVGYYNDPAAREDDDPGRLVADWRRRLPEPTGRVRIVGRMDMIITGGYNMYPTEMERMLSSRRIAPGALYVPVPERASVKLAPAYVVPSQQHDRSQLLAFAGRTSATLASASRRFVDESRPHRSRRSCGAALSTLA